MGEKDGDLFEDSVRKPPRVLPLLSDRGNRQQLTGWLKSHESLEYVPFEGDLFDADFDVCLLDRGALRRHETELHSIKETADPVIVPYLLLLPEFDTEHIGPDQNRLVDTITTSTVDEMVTLPINQEELEWRVRSLLRLRNQSIQAHATGRRYQALFESVPDAILVTDTDRNIVDCNQAFTDLFGYSLSEIEGEPTHTVYESNAEFEEMGDAIRKHNGDPEFTKTISYQTKTGDTFRGETGVFYLRGLDGEIQGFIGLIRDVSDRLERERELERYEAAVEGSTDMLIAADQERRVLFANERFGDLIGRTGADIRGSHLREILGADVFEEIEPRFERTLEGEQGQFVREQPIEGGEDRILDVHYYPLQEGEGDEIMGVVASLRDITESERRKRDLREFKQAVEAAGHAIYMTDPDGEITYANPAFEEVTGYPPSEAIGKNPRILKSGEMSEGYYEELWRTVTSGEVWEEEVVNRRKNGELYHARQTIAPVTTETGDVDAYVAIQTDITERKERIAQLSVYERAIEGADELIAAIDDEYQYLFANESYQEFHGLDAEEYATVTLGEVLGKETFERAEQYVKRAFAGETVTYRMTRTRAGVGMDHTFSIRYHPLTDDSDSIWGVVATMRDLTDQIERENHLLSLDRMLRHDLNIEMNVILGRASMIEEAGSPEIAEHAKEITAAGHELLDQANKEREIVQILSEPPTLTTVDLTARIRSVRDTLHRDYPAGAFELDVPDDLEIKTIPEIDRAIGELVENAIVHSNEATPEVRIGVLVNEGGVEIEIVDNGPPIPAEERAVVTDSSRIDDLTHTSGMGLWLVKRIVSRADGKLTFDRRDSGGNRVTIALPIRPNE